MLEPAGDLLLPDFTVRESDRARRVRLTVSAREGLVVVVPAGATIDARAIVASKEAWARRALARVSAKHALHRQGPEALLPRFVELRSVGRTLSVEYPVTIRTRASARERDHVVSVTGRDASARLAALGRWLDRSAHEILPGRLAALADDHGLSFSRVRITRARTRWGSCSSHSTISLNRSLVFLPPELVDAVILHELAHTQVRDHSPRFWGYLASLDPAALPHRAHLKEAGAFVPAWADA